MRTAAIVVALAFAASAVFAQDQPASKPDFSRPTLTRLFAEIPEPAPPPRAVEWHAGYVQFRALGTRWRIAYLPFFMPLSGSVNTGRGIGSNFADPFALTGTQIAMTERSFRDERALSRERRRIERSERDRVRANIGVNTQ